MANGIFEFEDCLLKHHVRTQGWLPSCKKRLKELKSNATSPLRKNKRLRYFTFCAVGALDVLMLEIEKILARSASGRLDNVFFFDRDEAHVAETTKRIVGAIGFPGDFVKTVCLDDPNEHTAGEALDPSEGKLDEFRTREEQRRIALRRDFICCFPFDVINLDLEQFFFPPKDPYPGKLLNALRKVFEWQTRELRIDGKSHGKLNSFSLMFTTQIGPPGMSPEHRKLLTDCLTQNLHQNAALAPLLEQAAGHTNLNKLEKNQFDLFFKLAVPKVIASILFEQDWYVDGERGLQVFEFERPSKDGPYRILHMIFEVRRQSPRREDRAPIEVPAEAKAAYNKAIQGLFSEPSSLLGEDAIDSATLQTHLDRVKARRQQLYPDG